MDRQRALEIACELLRHEAYTSERVAANMKAHPSVVTKETADAKQAEADGYREALLVLSTPDTKPEGWQSGMRDAAKIAATCSTGWEEALKLVVEAAGLWADHTTGYHIEPLREALALLSQPEPKPEGVPEFVYLNFEWRGHGHTAPVFSDGVTPTAESAYRYRFDSILTPNTPEKEGE